VPNVNVSVALGQQTVPWFLALPASGKYISVEPDTNASGALCNGCGTQTCVDDTSTFVPRNGPGDVLTLNPDPDQAVSVFDVMLN
jgi:hypothetical protein